LTEFPVAPGNPFRRYISERRFFSNPMRTAR